MNRKLGITLSAMMGQAFLSARVRLQSHRGNAFGAFGSGFHGVHGATLKSSDYPHTEFVLEGQAVVRLVFHLQGSVTALDGVPFLIPLDFVQQFQSVVDEYNRTDGGMMTLIQCEQPTGPTGPTGGP